MIDRELELVSPDWAYLEDMLASLAHPQTMDDPTVGRYRREDLETFLRTHPQGRVPMDPSSGHPPGYHFWMKLRDSGDLDPQRPEIPIAGTIGLRISDSTDVRYYLGHIGYSVFPPARGHHYAERSCRLLLPLARAHGIKELWITCNPDNWASRRTCERLGCTLVEIVPLPSWHRLYHQGEREKCRYRLML